MLGNIIHPISLVLILLVLSGCASRPLITDKEKNVLWEQHRSQIGEIDNWFIKGRVAIQLEKESVSASLQWQQTKDDYFLRLIAPLGQGTFELRGNSEVVGLKLAEEKVVYAEDPETLLQNQLGWYVPVSGLVYWIRGVVQPEANIDTILLDEKGRISELVQAGWHVNYRAYLKQGTYELPAKVSLHNDRLKVRFSIKQWNLSQ